jgi:hypothetical protein
LCGRVLTQEEKKKEKINIENTIKAIIIIN